MTNPAKYPGNELSLFAEAKNWKSYTSKMMLPYIGGNVLEVGAGIGSMTPYLDTKKHDKWVLAEPDPDMEMILRDKILQKELPPNCVSLNSTIDTISERFDTIIYIDVMEHIEHDKMEVIKAQEHLNKNGHLVILSPAHQSLYSPFDKAIGHYRRYTKKTLSALTSPGLASVSIKYLDMPGMLLSLANRLLLRQEYPSKNQIKFWDRFVVPGSVFLDRMINFSNGKSILGIWKKL